jgi:hypothetical protein
MQTKHTNAGGDIPLPNPYYTPESSKLSKAIGHDDLTDIIIWLQRDNDALNSCMHIARKMQADDEIQQALQELRAAEQRVTHLTATILADAFQARNQGEE